MSQDTPLNPDTSVAAAGSSAPEQPNRVVLVSYPKIIFLYPTALTAMFCAIVMWWKGDIPIEQISAPGNQNVSAEKDSAAPDAVPSGAEEQTVEHVVKIHTYHNVCARIFLTVLALNLVVISFDFPRTTSLTWFFALATIAIAFWFVLSKYPDLAPKIMQSLLSIKPWANASFYVIYTLIMLLLYGWVMISRRFDYWEVKGNELLHHHGFLSNLERHSAPNLRIDKEINDLFEYMLLRSGRLIIHASSERRAIVLENVLFINGKEDRITRMLGALQVRVRTDKE